MFSGSAVVSHPVAGAVTAVGDALAQARGAATWSLSGAELLSALRGLLAARAELDGLLLAVLREADGQDVPSAAGTRDAAGLLRALGRLDPAEARELADLARRTDPDAAAEGMACPLTGAAVRAGAMNRGQARVITRAVQDLPAAAASTPAPAVEGDGAGAGLGDTGLGDTGLGEAGPGAAGPPPAGWSVRAAAEAVLVEQAGVLDPVGLRAVARHVHERVVQLLGTCDEDDPAEAARVAAAAERDAYAARGVRPARRCGPGLQLVRVLLPDEMAAALLTGIDVHAGPRRTDDGYRDERSRGQRRADALVDIVTAAGAATPGAAAPGAAAPGGADGPEGPDRPGGAEVLGTGGPQRVVLVTLSYVAMLAGQADAGVLGTGEVLPPGQLRRMLCDAAVLPVVLGGRSQPLDLGRAARLFTPGQKRAILARDGGCFGLGCDPHPERTEAHHFVEWSSGGRTDIDTGGLVCEFWHRKIHAEGWTARLGSNGHPELVPPDWLDPDRRPRQNHRFRAGMLARPTEPPLRRDGARTSVPGPRTVRTAASDGDDRLSVLPPAPRGGQPGVTEAGVRPTL